MVMGRILSCFPSSSSSPARQTQVFVDDDDDFEAQHGQGNSSASTPLVVSGRLGQKVVPGCTFCGVSKEKGFNVVYEDDQLIAFHDRTPRAKVHLLIIPREHIVSSVKGLGKEHIPLLRSMTALGSTLVPPSPPPKMAFHIPPFSSVPHIHLHVFSGPHTFLGRLKYPISHPHSQARAQSQSHTGDLSANGRLGGKGLGWFVTPSQVESILQSNKKVGLGRG